MVRTESTIHEEGQETEVARLPHFSPHFLEYGEVHCSHL